MLQLKHKQYIAYILSALAFTFFTSCSTSKIVFDVVDPAEIELPGGIGNTSIVNLVFRVMDDKVNEISDLFKGKGELVNQIASQGTVAGLRKEIEISSNTQMLVSSLPGNEVATSNKPIDLSWDLIDSICQASTKQTLIVLNSFDFRTEIDYSGYERRTQTDPAKVWSNTIAYDVATDYVYIARLKAYVNLGWKIFYPASREIILDQVYLDSVFTESEGMTKNEADRMLPGIKNAVEDAGYIAGLKFARRIIPGRTTVERKYFTSGTNDFKQANNFVKMRYWEQAGEFWQMNIDNSDPKIAGSARYNLALVYEMNGKLEEAIDLVENAKKSYPNALMDKYLQILKQRYALAGSEPDR